MTKLSKILTGTAAAAMLTVGAAAPAEAQYRYRDRDRGIDAGDVIAGVAIVGGIAAIASAVSNSNRSRYGYSYGGNYGYAPAYGSTGYGYAPQGYGYGGGHYGAQGAVSACTYQAQRYGRVSITDVDQRNARRYRVRGVIDGNRGYYGGGYDRTGFTCTARDDGRITKFDTDRYGY
jgi:hypothetical protein